MAGLYPVIAVIGARHKWTDLSTGAVMALAGAGRVIGVIPAALMLPLTGLAGTQVVGCAIVSLAFFVWYAGLLELFIGDETNASKVGVCTVATMIGLGTGVLASGRQPFLYHAAPSEWLGRLSAIFGGCARWAQMLGPLVVGAAMQQWPGNPYIGITALAGLMSVAVVSLAVGWSTILELQASVAARAVHHTKEVHEEDEGRCCTAALSSTFAHVDGKPLAVVMLVALVLGTLRGARSMLIPVVALRHHYSAAATTVAVSASYSVDATLFWVAGWVLDHHGPRWSLLPTCALFALSSLVLAWIDEASPVALFAACILTMGLAESFSCGLINTLIGRVVPADSGPTPYVILRALPDGANVVGPLIAGITLSATGSIAATAYALAVVAGLGIIICFTAPVMSTTSTTTHRPLK